MTINPINFNPNYNFISGSQNQKPNLKSLPNDSFEMTSKKSLLDKKLQEARACVLQNKKGEMEEYFKNIFDNSPKEIKSALSNLSDEMIDAIDVQTLGYVMVGYEDNSQGQNPKERTELAVKHINELPNRLTVEQIQKINKSSYKAQDDFSFWLSGDNKDLSEYDSLKGII